MTPTLSAFLGILTGLPLGWFAALWWRRRASRDPIRKHPRGMEEKLPYRLNPSVLTPAEEAAYRALQGAIPAGFRVLPKVRLADLLQVNYGAGDRGEAHSRIGNKSLDFLICDDALAPVVAVTMDRTALDRTELQTRDFIRQVCEKVGLAQVSLPIALEYPGARIEALLGEHLPPRVLA